MLKALSVRNYVLIDSLEIDFPEGLIIITGQTGAGKSIILGALSLLMGAKADAEAIAGGAETCSVEAEFETVGDPELLSLLEENDLGEGGSLIRHLSQVLLCPETSLASRSASCEQRPIMRPPWPKPNQ